MILNMKKKHLKYMTSERPTLFLPRPKGRDNVPVGELRAFPVPGSFNTNWRICTFFLKYLFVEPFIHNLRRINFCASKEVVYGYSF